MKKVIMLALVILLSVSVLASAKESKNAPLEKVTFIHYKRDFDKNGKIDFAATNDTTTTSSAPCYKLVGIKWPSLPVSYIINPSNSEGLSSKFVTYAISKSAETWDAATARELFYNTYSIDYSAKFGVQNYKNVIAFGNYSNNNIIAVTTVWYTKTAKQIVEFDMLFNSYYNWGNATSNSNLMDLQNIATHEFGHSIGLSDLYNTCTSETMYGYSKAGETKKRTLNPGDIAGLRSIYG